MTPPWRKKAKRSQAQRRVQNFNPISVPSRRRAKRSEAKRSDAKRSEAKRSEAKRSDATRSEARRREAKRNETKRSEATRSEATRRDLVSRAKKKYIITIHILTIVRTNAGSECFSVKSRSPNLTTNLHQSDSDRCRSKYGLKIVMFTKETVKFHAINTRRFALGHTSTRSAQ